MRPDPYDVKMDRKLDDEFTDLVQKLYNEDGHCGNVYKQAPALLRYYEDQAWARCKEDGRGEYADNILDYKA